MKMSSSDDKKVLLGSEES